MIIMKIFSNIDSFKVNGKEISIKFKENIGVDEVVDYVSNRMVWYFAGEANTLNEKIDENSYRVYNKPHFFFEKKEELANIIKINDNEYLINVYRTNLSQEGIEYYFSENIKFYNNSFK